MNNDTILGITDEQRNSVCKTLDEIKKIILFEALLLKGPEPDEEFIDEEQAELREELLDETRNIIRQIPLDDYRDYVEALLLKDIGHTYREAIEDMSEEKGGNE